ncbi:2-(3-amino-3-carboxypropyl)histidine synthase subunit 2 [Anoplophora glabripennis]|uniref:2-(3-amino-3-carboxypropyl)histidine synthase subunit 2 n=1 Tax=Anoplophora glabripennis TaxID=217634 RepID=UPI0008748F0D|nr:2-(3-amino-3-carboxypropyl)histidine synthase subunit 2 [Anoplophora glabripennis]
MSHSQFYAHENVSLDKNVDASIKPVETKAEDLDSVYEIYKCVDWIKSNNFQKVCLQFPDYLLPDSSEVAFKLQSILSQIVYVLGDTAYESCCIDYIAAAHINADAIIHFGPVCFSKTSANIPYLNVYEKHFLNVEKLKASFEEKFGGGNSGITILIDAGYIHLSDDIQVAFQAYKNVKVQKIDEDPLVIKNKVIIFLGSSERKLMNIEFTFQPKQLYYYDGSIKQCEAQTKVLKRRNYLMEKIRDSKTIGIVIGTLGVQNYLKIIERLKSLIKSRGKKYYLISVGKPTVAKLANFQEIEIYVVVTCSLSEIYENRDFYRPIVTPFDVEAALNPDPDKNIRFSYDYNNFLNDKPVGEYRGEEETADVSLLTNKIRTLNHQEESAFNMDSNTSQIAVRPDGTIMLRGSRGAEFLAQRSWKGLERDVAVKEAELAKEGRLGTAKKYQNEPT